MRAETSFHTVHFFSDGAASQFKQKYNFVNLTYLQEQGVTVHWHFFATSHGKWAVDGVGGEVKRMAWLDVLSGKKRIQCASECVECVQAKNTRIKIIHVMEADIENIKELLDERWVGIKAIPGTQKLHSIQVVELDKVRYAKYSQSVPDACGSAMCSRMLVIRFLPQVPFPGNHQKLSYQTSSQLRSSTTTQCIMISSSTLAGLSPSVVIWYE